MKRLIFLICILTCALGIGAQTPHTKNVLKADAGFKSSPAKISDMAWLAGTWRGDGLGGESEEIWSQAQGGIMMGMYRMTQTQKPVFYEFMTLAETDGTLVMRLKHFHANLVGWEEKDKTVDFRWIRRDGGRCYFDGLTFDVVDPSKVNVYVAIKGKDGTVREEIFRYKRVK